MSKGRIIIGSGIVLIGIGLFLNTIGLGSFWGFIWPLFFLTVGGYIYATRNKTVGLLIMGLGFLFLIAELFGWSAWNIILPIGIITLGVLIITGNRGGRWTNSSSGSSERDTLNETVVFWGLDRQYKSNDFKGGKSFTLFGGSKFDLREVKVTKGGANLDVTSIFGATELILPPDMSVNIDGEGVFGAWENQIRNPSKGNDVLNITGEAIFGGVEIRN